MATRIPAPPGDFQRFRLRGSRGGRTVRAMTRAMTRALVTEICTALPGAEHSDPWGGGHDAWKVGGKMFAVVGTAADGVSVKTASIEDAAFLIELGRAERAPYFHRSWVRVPWGVTDRAELEDRISTSYRLVRGGLTRRVQTGLPPLPDPSAGA